MNSEKKCEHEKEIKEAQEALEVLNIIKQSVKGNTQLVRPLFIDRRFITLCIVCAICCGILFGCLLFSNIYWGVGATPEWTHPVFVILCILFLLICTLGKLIIIDKASKDHDKSLSLMKFSQLPEVFNLLLDSWITMIAIGTLCTFIGLKYGTWEAFVPGSYLYIAFILLMAGNTYSIAEYRALGIITLGMTVITALFMKSYFGLWITGSVTIYFLIFALVIHIASSKK